LIGGPIPAWLASAGVAASIMMLIPATIISINTFGALSARNISAASELSFVIVGMASFAAAVVQGAATPLVSAVTHFSDYAIGENVLIILGFVTMTLLGVISYALPHLTSDQGFSQKETSRHFWAFAWSVGTMFGALTFGGLFQGFALYDPRVEFISSIDLAMPFRFLYALGALVLLGSSIVFAVAFARVILTNISSPRTVRVHSRPPELVNV
jgi:cytochrome c oxidase cbb3-type subunit I